MSRKPGGFLQEASHQITAGGSAGKSDIFLASTLHSLLSHYYVLEGVIQFTNIS